MEETWFGIDAGYGMPGFSVATAILEGKVWKPGKVKLSEAFVTKHKNKENLAAFKKLSQTQQDCSVVKDTCERIVALLDLYLPSRVICELPVGGAKSANALRAMAFATAMTVSALHVYSLKSLTNPLVFMITPMQNKKGTTGIEKWKGVDYEHDKWALVRAVKEAYPDIEWPMKKRLKNMIDDGKAWAMADSMGCILTHMSQLNKLSVTVGPIKVNLQPKAATVS